MLGPAIKPHIVGAVFFSQNGLYVKSMRNHYLLFMCQGWYFLMYENHLLSTLPFAGTWGPAYKMNWNVSNSFDATRDISGETMNFFNFIFKRYKDTPDKVLRNWICKPKGAWSDTRRAHPTWVNDFRKLIHRDRIISQFEELVQKGM